MSEGNDFGTEWNKSAIYCPDCSGDCLTDGDTLSCIECAFQTSSDSQLGQRLIREHYDVEEL